MNRRLGVHQSGNSIFSVPARTSAAMSQIDLCAMPWPASAHARVSAPSFDSRDCSTGIVKCALVAAHEVQFAQRTGRGHEHDEIVAVEIGGVVGVPLRAR